MQNLQMFNTNIVTMTLKEITDLLGARHDRAFDKVTKMLESEEFGTVSINDIVYNDRGQTIKTYLLDKRQSIAVAARLNTSLLFKVIDRWQELEQERLYGNFKLPNSYEDALENLLLTVKENKKLEQQVQFLEPFKTKVDNSMAIFPNKESTDEGERVYKKYLKEKYPFIGNNSITNILEYYTKYKYKETKSYLKTEVDTAIKEFFDTCSYDISEQKLTVIIKHDCLLSGQMQVKKEHAIKYLNYTEEDFE